MAVLDLLRGAVIVGVLLVTAPVFAETDEGLRAKGWEEVLFDGKVANRFEALGESGIAVSSEGSVSLLQRPFVVDLERTPLLTWRWQVQEAAPPTDLRIKGEDDRSLALYVAFPYQPEQAGLWERMWRGIVERVAGKEAPGRILVYVWGGEGTRGERVPSPHLGKAGMMTILRPATSETGSWQAETVDIAEDYRQTFGSEPPDPISIAISADTDDTRTRASGLVEGITFVDRAGDS